jgi:hypothetical protein
MWEKLRSEKLCVLHLVTAIDVVTTRGGIFYISFIKMNVYLPYCGISCNFLSLCPQFDPRSFPPGGTESICASPVLRHVQQCYCPQTKMTFQNFAAMNAEVLFSGM